MEFNLSAAYSLAVVEGLEYIVYRDGGCLLSTSLLSSLRGDLNEAAAGEEVSTTQKKIRLFHNDCANEAKFTALEGEIIGSLRLRLRIRTSVEVILVSLYYFRARHDLLFFRNNWGLKQNERLSVGQQ